MNKEKVSIDISLWSVIKVIAALLLIGLVYYIREIFILVFIAFILAATLEPSINKLQKRRLPRALAIVLTFVVIISLFYLAFLLIVPPLTSQVRDLASNLPSLISSLNDRIFASDPGLANDLSNQAMGYLKNFKSLPSGALSGVFSTAVGIFGFFVSAIAVFALTFYMLLEKVGSGKSFFRFIPLKEKEKAIDIFDKITKKLSNWLKGQLALSGFVGLITFIILKIVGIKLALALSLFDALMELVPVIGPFISLIPAALFALTISPAKALAVVIAYLAVQQVENHILVPQIMRKAVGLSPLVILISILIGAKLLGIIGILLAVPIISSAYVILEELYSPNKVKA